MRTFFCGIFFPLLAAFVCTAQVPMNQQGKELELIASIEPTVVRPGGDAELVISLKIPRGFHIYGSRDNTHPTEVEVSEREGIAFEKASVPNGRRHQKSNGAVNYWLTGKKEIRQKIKVSEDAKGDLTINGELDYMICDEDACRPPAKLAFEVTLSVGDPEEVDRVPTLPKFAAPVRLDANGIAIQVESPGYAAPYLADIDADGLNDLLVGQYADGKIKFYRNSGDGRFAAGQWLKAEGQVAEVPGIW